jgi:hypothetical protein
MITDEEWTFVLEVMGKLERNESLTAEDFFRWFEIAKREIPMDHYARLTKLRETLPTTGA